MSVSANTVLPATASAAAPSHSTRLPMRCRASFQSGTNTLPATPINTSAVVPASVSRTTYVKE